MSNVVPKYVHTYSKLKKEGINHMRTLTCAPDVEVIGAAMLAIINNSESANIFPLLESHGLTEIDPEAWYPAQKWLTVMNEMARNPNMTSNFVAIGMSVSERIILPPHLQEATLPDILDNWDTLYHMQHHGDDIGYKIIERTSETSYRITVRDLYPDDFIYGLAYGFCRRFLPAGTEFHVQYESPELRRDFGDAEETVYLIDWQA